MIHRGQIAQLTDKRITYMQNILAGMRLVKLYCWEEYYTDVIMRIRRYYIVTHKLYYIGYQNIKFKSPIIIRENSILIYIINYKLI